MVVCAHAHPAAVIYLFRREVDCNPFLVFWLRGIDLAHVLQPVRLAGVQPEPAALYHTRFMILHLLVTGAVAA